MKEQYSAMNRIKLLRVARKTILLASFCFLIIFSANIDISLISNISINIWLLFLSIAVSILFRFYIAYIWHINIKTISKSSNINFLVMCEIFSASWIARYIPGGIFGQAGRILMAKEQNIDYKISISASVAETALQILSLCLLLIFCFSIVSPETTVQRVAFTGSLITVVASLIIMLRPARVLASAATSKIFGNKLSLPSYSTRQLISGFLRYLIAMTIANLAFAIFCLSLGIDYGEIDQIIVTNLTISIVSIIIFFVPAGLGVREVGLATMLAPILGAEMALVLSISSRAWTVAADVIFYGASTLIKKKE